MKFKYRSVSLSRVVVYGLVFTHFHVEAMTQEPLRIAHIYNLDKDNTKRLSAALLKLEAQRGEGPSLQPLLLFVQGLSFARQRRLSDDLRTIVNGLPSDCSAAILRALVSPTVSEGQPESERQSEGSLHSEGTLSSEDGSLMAAVALSLRIAVTVETEDAS